MRRFYYADIFSILMTMFVAQTSKYCPNITYIYFLHYYYSVYGVEKTRNSFPRRQKHDVVVIIVPLSHQTDCAELFVSECASARVISRASPKNRHRGVVLRCAHGV